MWYVDKMFKYTPGMTLWCRCSSRLAKRLVDMLTTPAKAALWWKFSLYPLVHRHCRLLIFNSTAAECENGNEKLLRECMHACV